MKKIVYAKYSNERADRFKIKTVIEQDEEGQRYVKKYAMTEAAKTHIQNIKKHEMALNKCADGTKFIFNHCSIEDGFISCEYVKGEPLSSVLNRMLAQKREEDALSLVQEYVAQLQKMATKTFTATEEFEKVFGKVEFAREQKSCEVTDIDLIFSNILVENDKWNVIDLEWIFTFPIPVNFLLYRAIRFSGSRIFDFANRFNILAAANISSEEQTIFDQMEQRFQQWVKAEGIALWDVEHMQQRFRIQDVYEENKHLNAEIQKRDTEIQRQNAEIQKRDAEIQRQNAETQKIYTELMKVTNSRSWHLTAPLRNLSNKFRRFFSSVERLT